MSATLVPRHVTAVSAESSGALLEIAALTAVTIDPMPGWVTGEPLAEQGVETTMPNLPELALPDLTPTAFRLRVQVVAADTVRLVVAPAGHRVLDEDGTWLGIVTDPQPGDCRATVEVSEDSVRVATELLSVTIGRHPFSIQVTDLMLGREVLRTAETVRQVAGFPLAPAVRVDAATTLNLQLAPGERITGFGEQFGPLVKNGQRLTLRVEDALGPGTGLAYKPVPVWHSTTGYTGFVNTGAALVADVGHSRTSVLSLSAPDDAFDVYLVAGADPKQRLRSYTALTGRGYVPGPWAFGYWMGRCRYHSAEEMLDVARTMRVHDVPCDVLHCDPDWLVLDRLNTDFIWNTDRFGDRADFVKALAGEGVRLSLWELPYLDPKSPRYAEARDLGFLAVDASGQPLSIENTPTPDGRPRGLVNFFDPAARAWWQDLHDEFLADGVAVFKTDFGEALPDAIATDAVPAQHAHNLYALRYNGAVSERVRERTGGDSLVWGRSGWAGSQRFPGQWGGDAESTVVGMQSTLCGGLSYALSAPGLWSHDIGGFFGGDLSPELYVRWTQFGALSPLMRAHGLRPREPWMFGERALQICREWIRLRYSLLPYLWQTAHEVAEDGLPMLRPLGLEFPDDPVAPGIDDQFLLGGELLVVPVFADTDRPTPRRYYLPEGRWRELLTGEVREGPAFHEELVPLQRQPVFVRDGAVLPRIELDGQLRNTDQLLERPWTLHVFGAATGDRQLIGFDRQPRTFRLDADTVVRHD
ncbi:MAG: TIM-barrel domain-containing protein [Jatrophihabitans sp.]